MVGHTAGVTETFVIPAGAGSYAPEVIHLRRTIVSSEWQFSQVLEVVVFISSLPATADIEIDILKPGGDPTNSSDWFAPVVVYSATGLQTALPVYARGVRIRGISGGTAGDAEVGVFYLY